MHKLKSFQSTSTTLNITSEPPNTAVITIPLTSAARRCSDPIWHLPGSTFPRRPWHKQASPRANKSITTSSNPRGIKVNFPSELFLPHALMCRFMRSAETVCWNVRGGQMMEASCCLWPSDTSTSEGQNEHRVHCRRSTSGGARSIAANQAAQSVIMKSEC